MNIFIVENDQTKQFVSAYLSKQGAVSAARQLVHQIIKSYTNCLFGENDDSVGYVSENIYTRLYLIRQIDVEF